MTKFEIVCFYKAFQFDENHSFYGTSVSYVLLGIYAGGATNLVFMVIFSFM